MNTVKSLWHGDLKPKPSMVEINADVAASHGFKPGGLRTPLKTAAVVRARSEAMWRMAMETREDGTPRFSLTRIGQFYGRDHTTVWHALVRHGDMIGEPYDNRRGGRVGLQKAAA